MWYKYRSKGKNVPAAMKAHSYGGMAVKTEEFVTPN
jgi:hypothetical protein